MSDTAQAVATDVSPERSYWLETKQPIYSAALILPFLLAYEIGLVWMRSRVINGGDAILTTLSRSLLRWMGFEFAFASAVILIVAFLIWQFVRKGTWSLRPPVLIASFLESLLYGTALFLLLHLLVPYLPGHLPGASAVVPAAEARVAAKTDTHTGAEPAAKVSGHMRPATPARPGIEDFVLFCGAGVYEELVFRVALLGLLVLVCRKFFHMESAYAAAWSVLLGAFIFSAFHHIGGEKIYLNVFLQRMLAGIYFAAIYYTRSFGIAAASHALYDILVGLNAWG